MNDLQVMAVFIQMAAVDAILIVTAPEPRGLMQLPIAPSFSRAINFRILVVDGD